MLNVDSAGNELPTEITTSEISETKIRGAIALLLSIKFDILAITKTYLREDICDDEIAITG